MDKYQINYIFSEEIDIHDIFLKVLNKELKKYIFMISQNKKDKLLSYPISLGDKNC